MKDYRPGDSDEPEINTVVAVWAGLRVLISVFGIVVMVVGLSLSVKVFDTVYDAVKSPADTQATVEGWAHAVGGDGWQDQDQRLGFPISRIAALAVLAFAAFFMIILALKIMTSGAKMIMWSAEDRQVVERFTRSLKGGQGPPPPLPGA